MYFFPFFSLIFQYIYIYIYIYIYVFFSFLFFSGLLMDSFGQMHSFFSGLLIHSFGRKEKVTMHKGTNRLWCFFEFNQFYLFIY
jgi:hypothetical protein